MFSSFYKALWSWDELSQINTKGISARSKYFQLKWVVSALKLLGERDWDKYQHH